MTTPSLVVESLTCEYHANPLGIDVIQPRLGWKLGRGRAGVRQVAYHILAASSPGLLQPGRADLWDSGRIDSDQSQHVLYMGRKLVSRQRVYWKVDIWTHPDGEAGSATAWFEMGLLKRGDWKAKWIGGALVGGLQSSIPAPYLRRTFSVGGEIQRARLYVTALGLYECSLNGQPVGDAVFAPGWTDYHKRVQYQVYDVTDLLQDGENVLGAILGDGWAVGHVAWFPRQHYFDRPRFLAQLEISRKDGSALMIRSDRTWKCQYGPVLESDLLMGEAYDARLEWAGWHSPGFDDRDWHPANTFGDPGAVLAATNGPVVRRIEELRPVSDPDEKSSNWSRRFIFDLGQNMVGRIRFHGRAPRGTTVQFRFAEVLDADGELYTENLRTARAVDHYTFKGSELETWEPKFTFHGFRYVEVTGYPGPVDRDSLVGVVLHSDMEQIGFFECSDPLINQLQQNIVWGQKGNFVDVPTDCPQRDERLGWTGDIQVFARTAAFNFDIAGFMARWLQDAADAQTAEGKIPAVVPPVELFVSDNDGGPAWADAVIICPWTVYLYYGDRKILEANYGAMRKFMDFLLETSPHYIRCAPEYDGWHGFGDWVSINADTPRDLIGTAFLAYDASLMAKIATALGKTQDATRYRDLFAEVRKAFAVRYLAGGQAPVGGGPATNVSQGVERMDAISRGNLPEIDYGPVSSRVFNTVLFRPTQTSYVLALHFDLLPPALRPLAVEELVADVVRRDTHLSTGFVGTPYLPHVLSENGRLDVAYALLNQKSWPSWLYSVTQGATTIWERWDGWTVEKGFQDPGMNSFNHYAYGSIGSWLYSTVAGIEVDPVMPGYKHILLRPQPGGGLTHACGKLETRYGEVVSEWRSVDGVFEWDVSVPPNTSATAHVPARRGDKILLNGESVEGLVHELAAGKHLFRVS